MVVPLAVVLAVLLDLSDLKLAVLLVQLVNALVVNSVVLLAACLVDPLDWLVE